MRQMTFSNSGFDVHHKPTRRERFLAEMEAVVPWGALCALIEPHYPKGDRGRPPIGIDLGREAAPDETTICKFRHLIEEHALGKEILASVNAHLQAKGVAIGTGTIVDATIIAAASSTKNADGTRDPEMHQVKKGNQWHFGMKAHLASTAWRRSSTPSWPHLPMCMTAR